MGAHPIDSCDLVASGLDSLGPMGFRLRVVATAFHARSQAAFAGLDPVCALWDN